MADKLEQAIETSVQDRARGRESALSFVFWLAGANEIISPWWSRQRDAELRRFTKQVDYLSGTVNTLEAMLTTIPIQVVAKDLQIRAHVKQAEEFTRVLTDESDFGEGWGNFYGKFIEDYVTQDNGAFAEIIGEGDPVGPIVGRPLGVAHLDSWRCRRTGDPIFPVVYHGADGNITKLHRTRVIEMASMPSPDEVMYGVGFSAVSRCINVAQNLLDILVFNQEKLGSRPQRQILVTSGGLDPDDVTSAFQQANENMTNQRLSRYSRTVVVGAAGLENAGLDPVDLASLPDGFDQESSVSMGMAAIALAFGMDPRELWPAQAARSTRAEALISHIKQRGKGPGQIIQATERKFNYKFLPQHLALVFDFQDDAQDAQVAEIKNTRSTYHNRDLELGLLDTRVTREQMVIDGDLSRAQFAQLELDDGRTEDGREVIALFWDPDHAEDLAIGIDNVLDFQTNLPSEVLFAIMDRRTLLMTEISSANPGRRTEIERSIAALDALAQMYGGLGDVKPSVNGNEEQPAQLMAPDEEDEEEPEPTGNLNLDQDDLDLKSVSPADAITRAARAVERVNQKALAVIPTSEQVPVILGERIDDDDLPGYMAWLKTLLRNTRRKALDDSDRQLFGEALGFMSKQLDRQFEMPPIEIITPEPHVQVMVEAADPPDTPEILVSPVIQVMPTPIEFNPVIQNPAPQVSVNPTIEIPAPIVNIEPPVVNIHQTVDPVIQVEIPKTEVEFAFPATSEVMHITRNQLGLITRIDKEIVPEEGEDIE